MGAGGGWSGAARRGGGGAGAGGAGAAGAERGGMRAAHGLCAALALLLLPAGGRALRDGECEGEWGGAGQEGGGGPGAPPGRAGSGASRGGAQSEEAPVRRPQPRPQPRCCSPGVFSSARCPLRARGCREVTAAGGSRSPTAPLGTAPGVTVTGAGWGRGRGWGRARGAHSAPSPAASRARVGGTHLSPRGGPDLLPASHPGAQGSSEPLGGCSPRHHGALSTDPTVSCAAPAPPQAGLGAVPAAADALVGVVLCLTLPSLSLLEAAAGARVSPLLSHARWVQWVAFSLGNVLFLVPGNE